MDMNNVNIEEIVKQVLSGMTGTRTCSSSDSCTGSSGSAGRNPENSKSCNDDRQETLRTSGVSRFRKSETMISLLK